MLIADGFLQTMRLVLQPVSVFDSGVFLHQEELNEREAAVKSRVMQFRCARYAPVRSQAYNCENRQVDLGLKVPTELRSVRLR